MSDYDLANLRLMIVDDYQPMRHIMRGILREWGITHVGEAANGREALEELKNFAADVLITDYRMFPIDGLELTRTIRSGEAGVDPYLPIILITAYTEMNTILDARDAGVNEFLAKPISAKLVYYRIRSIIEHPRPFVRAEEFMGPDRRRRTLPLTGEDRREVEHEVSGAERQGQRE
jgi:CheY-like chemotaxis protein